MANRNLTTRFPTSYRWSPYVTPNSPKWWLKKRICHLKKTFPCISVTDEATDFKCGMLLGFAKAHHDIPPEEKVGVAWAREAPQNLGLTFNISATADANELKFCTPLGFAKANHKFTTRWKSGRSCGLAELRKIWGFPLIFLLATSTLVHSLGLPRSIIISHPEEKVRLALG